MSHVPFFLAQDINFNDTVAGERNLLTSGFSQLSIVLMAVSAVIVLSFIGVFIFRKQLLRRKRHHHHRKSTGVVSGQNSRESAPPEESQTHGKRRRVRRKRRHRNPTLAETRGLPPNRDEQSMVPPSA